MIRVSEAARRAVRRLVTDAGAPGGGVRIAFDSGAGVGGEPSCELEIADRPEDRDVVVETGGVRLFIDARAAEALDDAELVVENGDLALAVPEAAGCGPT